MTSEERRVTNQPERSRFVGYLGDREAGELDYRLDGDRFAALHTEVHPEFAGTGMGSLLVRTALEHAEAQGWAVLPHCCFFRDWLARHEGFLGLVPESERERFGLPAG